MKTTLKHCIFSNSRTQGGIYSHQGRGARLATAGQKDGRSRARTAAETRPRPHFRGSSGAARAALWAARCPVCPLSVAGPGF